MYGPIAADHLRRPRNLGKLPEPDGVGHVEEAATDTQVTLYVRVERTADGEPLVQEARFRAFGCGGCIIAASATTELVRGEAVTRAAALDAGAILAALEDGLPPDQRYCADLVIRALRLALQATETV